MWQVAPPVWRQTDYLQSRLPSQCWLVGRQARSLQEIHSGGGLEFELLKTVFYLQAVLPAGQVELAEQRLEEGRRRKVW